MASIAPGLIGFGSLEADEHTTAECFESLHNLIGDTPLAEIHARVDGREVYVYAKLESYNFTGSIKDRMALHMLYGRPTEAGCHPSDGHVDRRGLLVAIRAFRSPRSGACSVTPYASTCPTG